MNKFLGALCAGLVVCVGVASGHAQTLSGQWSGTVHQTGPRNASESYPATMKLNGASGTMDYPSLGCGGSLTFMNKNGNIYYYRENITYGANRCTNGGMVAVQPGGNGVTWAWNLSGMTAAGQLSGTTTVAGKSCSNWLRQADGSNFRVCVGDDGRNYCEQTSGAGPISRVQCR